MKKLPSLNIIFLFLFVAIILIALSFLSFSRINNLINDSRRVNQSDLIKLSLEKAYTALCEKESAMRAHIISKNSFPLTSYFMANDDIKRELNKIESLIKDNPEQQQNEIALKIAVKQRIEMMDRSLALFNASNISDQDLLNGKELMAKVRTQIGKMNAEEDKLAAIRRTAFKRGALITPLFTVLLSIGSILILIAAYYRIMQDIKISNTLRLSTEQGQYARSLIEASLDPLVTISADGKILDVNAASIKVTGTSRENLINTDFSNYFTEPKKAQEGYLQVFEKGFVSDFPLTIKHKDGNLTDVLYNASVYKDSQGKILGVFAAARDVTEQKWSIDLKIANKELVFQNEEKEKRAEELVFLVKELESLNYISSHDLQEPLRQIQIFSSRISDDDLKYLSDAGKTYFEKINNAAKRMQNLINDLLAYSRSKTEARKFKVVNLNQIINEVTEDFEEIISDKNATVEVAELGAANVITFQFRQLMYNLIGNALKFSKPDTPPHIIIKNEKVKSNHLPDLDQSSETEYYHISVTDNGIGFEQQYKDRIFEVFQRLHDKQKIAGTGIGLAIVKNIVANHNGIITATGELNKGATFDIYIPTIQKL